MRKIILTLFLIGFGLCTFAADEFSSEILDESFFEKDEDNYNVEDEIEKAQDNTVEIDSGVVSYREQISYMYDQIKEKSKNIKTDFVDGRFAIERRTIEDGTVRIRNYLRKEILTQDDVTNAALIRTKIEISIEWINSNTEKRFKFDELKQQILELEPLLNKYNVKKVSHDLFEKAVLTQNHADKLIKASDWNGVINKYEEAISTYQDAIKNAKQIRFNDNFRTAKSLYDNKKWQKCINVATETYELGSKLDSIDPEFLNALTSFIEKSKQELKQRIKIVPIVQGVIVENPTEFKLNNTLSDIQNTILVNVGDVFSVRHVVGDRVYFRNYEVIEEWQGLKTIKLGLNEIFERKVAGIKILKLPNDAYIGKYEVTQAQWEAITKRKNPSYFIHPQRPVESVSWEDCQVFFKKLNSHEDVKKFKENYGLENFEFRLPTKEEWEYACNYSNVDEESASMVEYAWFKDNSDGTTEFVGEFKPNAWGLYDMHGNVSEWTSTIYKDNYICCGGNYTSYSSDLFKYFYFPKKEKTRVLGFRVFAK